MAVLTFLVIFPDNCCFGYMLGWSVAEPDLPLCFLIVSVGVTNSNDWAFTQQNEISYSSVGFTERSGAGSDGSEARGGVQ